MNICLVAPNVHLHNSRLQPWRFLLDFCQQQQQAGHTVTLITNPDPNPAAGDTLENIPVCYIPSVQAQDNPTLWATIHALQPDCTYWNIGLTSFLHLGLDGKTTIPVVGIFTAPVYTLSDLYRAGIANLIGDYRLAGIHVLGALIPNFVLQKPLRNGTLNSIITLSETTRQALVSRGLPPEKITVVKPSINPIWEQTRLTTDEHISIRAQMNIQADDFVVAYFGAPKKLRGIDQLIHALALALPRIPRLKLLLLSRRHAGEMSADEQRVQNLIAHYGLHQQVHIISGFLDLPQLIKKVASADAVALPFQLVPSDVPLSILEAKALGKPVITTRIGCLPELVANPNWIVEPNSPQSLADCLCTLAAQTEAMYV